MIATVTLRAESRSGGRNHYVARLIGRDPKMTFAREFLGHEAELDEAGIYEIQDIDKRDRKSKEYVALLSEGEGVIKARLRRSQAMALVRRREQGEPLESMVAIDPDGSASIRSKAAAKRAAAGATVENAIAACWEVLSLLPEKEGKKVLRALKNKVAPKKAASSKTQDDAA